MAVACLSLFVALSGVTYAATGGNFILGRANNATSQTALTSNNAGKALNLTQQSSGTGATALGLNVPSGKTPFTVNSGTKVANLNADKLDGLDSSALRGARAYATSGGANCSSLPAPPVFCSIPRGKGVAYVVRVADGVYCVGVNGISAADPTSVALTSVEWSFSDGEFFTFERRGMSAMWRRANRACVSTEFEIVTERAEAENVRQMDGSCCVLVAAAKPEPSSIPAFAIVIP
jgi:hypothetical protein